MATDDLATQGISGHGIDIFFSEYPSLSTRGLIKLFKGFSYFQCMYRCISLYKYQRPYTESYIQRVILPITTKQRVAHLPACRDKMTTILHTTFSNSLSCRKRKIVVVTKGPISNNPAFIQTMACRRTGNKPISQAMAYMRHSASVS